MLASPAERKAVAGRVVLSLSGTVTRFACRGFRADGMESVRLTEIYARLEEIEADKAPAR